MVTVRSTPESVSTYRDLLVSEWSKSLPQEVLSLLWTSLGGRSSSGETAALFQLLDPNDAAAFPSDYFQSIVVRIADGTRFIKLADLPELPTVAHPLKRLSSLARQANKLATYLTLPALTTVTGNTDFFVDVLALTFQAAIHFVLPDLRRKHEAEHALLLHSAVLFAVGYVAHDPAHYSYMMSMIHGYMGDENQMLRSLFASFRFTSPQDHSYLTKAQEYWTELLDLNRYEEAERFLLSLDKWTLPAQQDEVREMVVAAFKYIVRTNRAKPLTRS